MNQEQFAEELRQEVLSRCTDVESEHFEEDSFVEVMLEYLTQANEIDDGEICYHKSGARGEKLNAFSMAPDAECLDLFVASYNGTVPPTTVSSTEVAKHFKWLRRFLEVALSGAHQHMEESSPVFDAAQRIHAERESYTKARFFLLTDGIVKGTSIEPAVLGEIDIKHHIWDLEKLRRLVTSRMRREPIEIDFAQSFGALVPSLESSNVSDEYRTFLTFFRGSSLASLYAEYGPRLLEKNVRSFLQAKGKINKGIRNTILTQPQRFLAYNNGISATAERIEIEAGPNGLCLLKKAVDFQIVNGGQTTASIYHAVKKDAADLSGLVVQVKLTVLNDPASIDVFVPLISEYANSQNKVNAADFSANRPYHIALEELSRRVWAPSSSGTDRQTRWYYERARGSYLDDKGREGTPARMRAFEAMNPLRQKFTKTDLAKFENTWAQYPHVVCLGAEKNFVRLTVQFAERGYPAVDETYFQRLIAKAILFRTAERLVGAQKYGGYRAQIVTYSLAWLAHATGQRIDLDGIWRAQSLSQILGDAITEVSAFANDHILAPPPNRRNPGEWCKREECWDAFRATHIPVMSRLEEELIRTNRPLDATGGRQTLVQDQDELQAIMAVKEAGGTTWFEISHWAKQTQNLLPWQRGLAFSLGKIVGAGKDPSTKQAVQGVKILLEAKRRGFRQSGEGPNG